MGTTASKEQAVAARHAFRIAFARSAPLPPPYQLAIEDTPFQLAVLGPREERCAAEADAPLAAGTWFSVALRASTKKRYLYLVQKESGTGIVVLLLLFDRGAPSAGGADDTADLRLPPSNAWMRAVVDGELYVLASDLVLTRKSIAAWIGGFDPPPIAPPADATV